MTVGDMIGLAASYAYAFGLLFAVEALGRQLRWDQEFTRKIIHIGAGMWTWAILALFDHWTIGIIPFATFILLNYVFYRKQTFQAMDTQHSSPGTVYFAISITILFALLWRTGGARDRVPFAMAGVMAMTLGDAMASIVGRRWGVHTLPLSGHTRTWEGTAAMAGVTLISVWATLVLLSGSSLSPASIPLNAGQALWMALVGMVVATAAEAASPAGTDNLTVPLLTGLALFLVGGI